MTEVSDRSFADIYRNAELATFAVTYSDIEDLVKDWDRNGKILDVGFGAERSMGHLRELGFNNIVGVDSSWHMLKQASSKNKIVQMWGSELGFAPNIFDYISIKNVFQDIPDYTTLVSYLNEAARVVKTGGKILIMNPTPESYEVDSLAFECSQFQENILATEEGRGSAVKVKLRGSDEVFVDHIWRDEDFRVAFDETGLKVVAHREPLANNPEGYITENVIPPWMIYLLSVEE